jgi:hypothetical protein
VKRTSAHPSVKALRASFASLRPLRVTAGRAPVDGQLWPEGELPAVAADRIFDTPRSAPCRSQLQPDRTDHLLRKAVILTCYRHRFLEGINNVLREAIDSRQVVSLEKTLRRVIREELRKRGAA